MRRRRTVRVPASSANLGPGFDVMGAALDLHMEVDVVETGALRRPHRPADRARPPQPDRARVRRAAPGRRLRVHDPLRHPALRRPRDERRGDRRRASSPPTRSSSSAPTCWPRRRELEGHPDNVAAALLGGFVLCADGHAERFEPPPGLECLLVVPAQAVRTAKAREALPSRIPVADAVFNIAHASLLVLGLARGDLGLVARGLGDRIHQPRRAHLYPRSWELVQQRARPRRARARRSPAPARPCSCGATSRAPAPSSQRAAEDAEGWAEVCRVPFTPHGRRSPRAVTAHGALERICTRSQTGWRSTGRGRERVERGAGGRRAGRRSALVAHLADQRAVVGPDPHDPAAAAVADAVGGELVDREHEVPCARLSGAARPRPGGARRSSASSSKPSSGAAARRRRSGASGGSASR